MRELKLNSEKNVEILCSKLIYRRVTIRTNFLTDCYIYKICFFQLLNKIIKRFIIYITIKITQDMMNAERKTTTIEIENYIYIINFVIVI